MDNWTEDPGIDLTAAFKGITTPIRDLIDQIHLRGWDLKSLKFTKDQWEATAKSTADGGTVTSYGPTEQTATGNVLLKVIRTEHIRASALKTKVGMWKSGWEDRLNEIAEAYAKAPVYDPKAAAAWQQLAQDSVHRARMLHQQLRVEVTDDPVPYKSVQDLVEDVTKKRHILLSRANANHPVWSLDQVLAFRLVHDVLGHVVVGSDWGWFGENAATRAHMPLVGIEAQKALFTETIGQTAYGALYRQYGAQKIAILKDIIEKSQGENNLAGHAPLHPSQSVVPNEIPRIEPIGPDPAEHRHAAVSGHRDPNDSWQSAVAPLPDNGFLWQRQTGTDPLDVDSAVEALGRHQTDWHLLSHPDGSPDRDTQRQSVLNALRAVLMAPRKDEKWAAVHYQHIRDIPASVSDPKRFHDALAEQREIWNQARGHAPQSHSAPYHGDLQKFKGYLKALSPTLSDKEVQRKAAEEFQHMWNEEEERVLSEDKDGLFPANEVAKLVSENMAKRLKIVTKPRIDEKFDFGDKTVYHTSREDPEMYGSWLGNHVQTIAALGQHADALTQAAIEDLHQHGGTGHHFRARALGLRIPGLSPKEVSQAWTHLAPYSSQVAAVDPHILDLLGHTPDEASDRDYFKHERELIAGRDAAGYAHVPLGAFTQALWNQKVYGPGVHPDTTHFRALNPAPYNQINWLERPERTDIWAKPYWWESTQPAREQVAKDFDRSIGSQVPKDAYPFQFDVPEAPRTASSADLRTPWFVGQDGISVQGSPGQSLMHHLTNSLGMTTEQIWAMDPEVGKT